MPIDFQCEGAVVTAEDVAKLWEETRAVRSYADEEVVVKCVSEDEVRSLNQQYREQDKPTNVLTFSYPSSDKEELEGVTHDIALCLPVIEREAEEQSIELRDYTALVITHALLHVTGLDHEESESAAEEVSQKEEQVLKACGFTPHHLS